MVVNEAMRAHNFAPASEPKLTKHMEVQDPIRGLKVGKAQALTVSPTGL
jgi:hypothetical protein